MTASGDSDPQLVKTVLAHIDQIGRASTHAADEPTLQMLSGSLRLLLADGALARAWTAAGVKGPLRIGTWIIDSVRPNEPVLAYCGGGDLLPNIPFSACRGATLRQATIDLSTFCRQTRIQIEAEKISTTELVQYVANALGGSHYDPSGRAARKPKADVLRRLLAGEIEDLSMRVGERSLLHHELLSIAQALVRSEGVATLRQAVLTPAT